MRKTAILFVFAWIVSLSCAGREIRAQTALGDAGHFLVGAPRTFFHNEDGRAFTIKVRLMVWPVEAWNPARLSYVLKRPDGDVVGSGDAGIEKGVATIDVPPGKPGVYTFEPNMKGDGKIASLMSSFWIESTLAKSVVHTGDPAAAGGHAIEGRRLVLAPSTPRRWWFFVPRGTKTFTLRAQRAERYMSMRERWGFTVMSPRGQRMAVLWGQPPWPEPKGGYRGESVATVQVEPGTSGRFWCFEARYGDGHNHSKPNVCLEGVPPYVARSPEEWFDPTTGKAADEVEYDDDPFMQFAPDGRLAAGWPGLQHFTPCPSVGDPDGVEVLGDALLALRNTQQRPLRFRIGTYLTRATPDKPELAEIVVTNPDGGDRAADKFPVLHLHEVGKGDPAPLEALTRRESLVRVSNAARWFVFTYPATPIVLVGAKQVDGFSRWRFEVGGPRNWYFMVPRGTRSFDVRAVTAAPGEVVELSVNSPDRALLEISDTSVDRTVAVPPGLDGKIWHIRMDIAAASSLEPFNEQGNVKTLGLSVTLDLRGIPTFLAPTREQWFVPAGR